MTDLEISKQLALAIGWKDIDLMVSPSGRLYSHRHIWSEFDYRDYRVIGPIAERYNYFPYCIGGKWWLVGGAGCPAEETPQKAIAMAVIQGAGK